MSTQSETTGRPSVAAETAKAIEDHVRTSVRLSQEATLGAIRAWNGTVATAWFAPMALGQAVMLSSITNGFAAAQYCRAAAQAGARLAVAMTTPPEPDR